MWEWAMKSNIQLTAAHIPRKQNIIANRESRAYHVDSEWMLSPRYLHQSLNLLSFKPNIDLFATQVDRQFSDYVAYKLEPEAKFIDAFTIDWSGLKFYAFPPIAIISSVLSKISQDEAEGIIVVPYWPDQVWYLVMLKMLISIPTLVNSMKSLLQLPQSPDQNHPMWRKADMIVAHLSGAARRAQHCQKQLLRSYQLPGDRAQRNVTMGTSNGLLTFIINGRPIPFVQPLKQA